MIRIDPKEEGSLQNHARPALGDQSLTVLANLGSAIVLDRFKAELVTSRWLASVDVGGEMEAFLAGYKSQATQNTYRAALTRFLRWCEEQQVHPYVVSSASLEGYIEALASAGLSPTTINALVAAVSSWYTWLSRRHPLKNPVAARRRRVPRPTPRVLVYPDDADIEVILAHCPPRDAAGVAVMAFRGLRVGALPTLRLEGDKFVAESKGATVSGILPQRAMTFIREASLDPVMPFRGSTPAQWSSRLAKRMVRMARAGSIKAAYSVHDFRHYFASSEYRKHHDLLALARLLGHATSVMTERYVHGQLGL